MTTTLAIEPKVAHLLQLFEDHGFAARIVGGSVRDRLLGLQPRDYDIATDARPDQVTQLMEKFSYKVFPTGIEHGTVTVVIDHASVEVTTLREDKDTDGRHAVVQFGCDFVKDASRRDFTINAMSEDLRGQVYDYFEGQSDLSAKKIRFVGDPGKRIQEDYLRILRLFRFAARFELTADPATIACIARYKDGLKQISRERIYSEFVGLFSCPKIAKEVFLLRDTAVIQIIFPEVQLSDEFIQFFDQLSLNLPLLTIGRWSCFFMNSKPLINIDILKNYKFSNEESKKISRACCKMNLPLVGDSVAQQLSWIDNVEKDGGKRSFSTFFLPFWTEYVRFMQEENQLKQLQEVARTEKLFGFRRTEKLPITGKDIATKLHLQPGPKIGKFLNKAKKAFLDGEWTTHEEGLDWIDKTWG